MNRDSRLTIFFSESMHSVINKEMGKNASHKVCEVGNEQKKIFRFRRGKNSSPKLSYARHRLIDGSLYALPSANRRLPRKRTNEDWNSFGRSLACSLSLELETNFVYEAHIDAHVDK